MSQSLRRPKDRTSVLVITADNMTSELLKNAFAHGRKGFTVETLTGSPQKIIGVLGANGAVGVRSDMRCGRDGRHFRSCGSWSGQERVCGTVKVLPEDHQRMESSENTFLHFIR